MMDTILKKEQWYNVRVTIEDTNVQVILNDGDSCTFDKIFGEKGLEIEPLTCYDDMDYAECQYIWGFMTDMGPAAFSSVIARPTSDFIFDESETVKNCQMKMNPDQRSSIDLTEQLKQEGIANPEDVNDPILDPNNPNKSNNLDDPDMPKSELSKIQRENLEEQQSCSNRQTDKEIEEFCVEEFGINIDGTSKEIISNCKANYCEVCCGHSFDDIHKPQQKQCKQECKSTRPVEQSDNLCINIAIQPPKYNQNIFNYCELNNEKEKDCQYEMCLMGCHHCSEIIDKQISDQALQECYHHCVDYWFSSEETQNMLYKFTPGEQKTLGIKPIN